MLTPTSGFEIKSHWERHSSSADLRPSSTLTSRLRARYTQALVGKLGALTGKEGPPRTIASALKNVL